MRWRQPKIAIKVHKMTVAAKMIIANRVTIELSVAVFRTLSLA